MRSSASATKRIAAPSHRTQHHQNTSLRSPYPSAPIQATPNVNRMVRKGCGQTRSRNVSEVEHDTDPLFSFLRSSIVAACQSYFDGQHIFAACPGRRTP